MAKTRMTAKQAGPRLSLMASLVLLAGAAWAAELVRDQAPSTNDSALAGSLQAVQRATPQPTPSRIGYIRSEIPSFMVPPFRGQRYEELAPDTLDLAEHAKLAIHGITCLTDPDSDYDAYFFSLLYQNPPVMRHQYSDICQVKYYEALPLLRTMTGCNLNENVDRTWMESILKSIGPDGLCYWSTQGRPWLQGEDMYNWCPVVCWEDGTTTSTRGRKLSQVTEPAILGRVIAALTIYYQRDHNSLWDQTVRGMIGHLEEMMIDKGSYCYLPVRLYVPGARKPLNAPMPVGMNAEEIGARLIQGLSQYYHATHYEPARALAGKLVEYFWHYADYYDSQGRFVDPGADGRLAVGGHFHAHAIGLLGMLEYAMAVGDRDLMEFVTKSYEWARFGTYGSNLVGWFPENVKPGFPLCELCCPADMIALAIKLSRAGMGDYWDDADRWLRNQFIEGQYTRTDWVDRITKGLEKKPFNPKDETADHVAERSLGAFTAYCTGNDYGILPPNYLYGHAACCVGNSARTLYYAWENILDFEQDRLSVNLLLNRSSTWADVHSYIPYEGRVDVRVKKPCGSLRVRIPEWITASRGEVHCFKDDRPCKFTWEVRYLSINHAGPGEVITIQFPVSERTVTEKIGGVDYTLILKGNTVVAIDPPGKFRSFYQRDHYRENEVRWVRRERFVTEQEIAW